MPHRAAPFALFLLLTACNPPDGATDFLAAAHDASTRFPLFVHDLAGSCERRNLAVRPPNTVEDATSALTEACKEDVALAPDLLIAGKVLTAYFEALNHLASSGAVSYDKELGDLATKLQTSASLSQPTTDAIKSLSQLLANAATSHYQRRKLAQALTTADPQVAAITSALAHIVGVEYVRDLDNELESVKTRYRDAMRPLPSDSPLAFLLQRQWRDDLALLRKRREAAVQYAQALDKVRDGHKQLASQDLAKQLGPDTTAIHELCLNIPTAF